IGGVFGIAYTVLILRSVLRRALGRAPPESYQAITSASSLDVLVGRLEKKFADPRGIAKVLKQMAERGQLGPSIQPDIFDKPGWEWVKELNLSEAALYHILIEAFRAASKAEPKKSTHQEGPAFLSQYLHIFQEYLRMPLTITTLWVVNSFLIKPLTGATQQFVFGANRDFHNINGIENIVATEFAKQLGAKGLGEKALPTILPTSWVAKAAEKGLDRMERRAAEIALGKRNLISLPILMLLTAFIGIGRFLTSRFVFSAISKFVAPFIVFGLLGPAGLLVSFGLIDAGILAIPAVLPIIGLPLGPLAQLLPTVVTVMITNLPQWHRMFRQRRAQRPRESVLLALASTIPQWLIFYAIPAFLNMQFIIGAEIEGALSYATFLSGESDTFNLLGQAVDVESWVRKVPHPNFENFEWEGLKPFGINVGGAAGGLVQWMEHRIYGAEGTPSITDEIFTPMSQLPGLSQGTDWLEEQQKAVGSMSPPYASPQAIPDLAAQLAARPEALVAAAGAGGPPPEDQGTGYKVQGARSEVQGARYPGSPIATAGAGKVQGSGMFEGAPRLGDDGRGAMPIGAIPAGVSPVAQILATFLAHPSEVAEVVRAWGGIAVEGLADRFNLSNLLPEQQEHHPDDPAFPVRAVIGAPEAAVAIEPESSQGTLQVPPGYLYDHYRDLHVSFEKPGQLLGPYDLGDGQVAIIADKYNSDTEDEIVLLDVHTGAEIQRIPLSQDLDSISDIKRVGTDLYVAMMQGDGGLDVIQLVRNSDGTYRPNFTIPLLETFPEISNASIEIVDSIDYQDRHFGQSLVISHWSGKFIVPLGAWQPISIPNPQTLPEGSVQIAWKQILSADRRFNYTVTYDLNLQTYQPSNPQLWTYDFTQGAYVGSPRSIEPLGHLAGFTDSNTENFTLVFDQNISPGQESLRFLDTVTGQERSTPLPPANAAELVWVDGIAVTPENQIVTSQFEPDRISQMYLLNPDGQITATKTLDGDLLGWRASDLHVIDEIASADGGRWMAVNGMSPNASIDQQRLWLYHVGPNSLTQADEAGVSGNREGFNGVGTTLVTDGGKPFVHLFSLRQGYPNFRDIVDVFDLTAEILQGASRVFLPWIIGEQLPTDLPGEPAEKKGPGLKSLIRPQTSVVPVPATANWQVQNIPGADGFTQVVAEGDELKITANLDTNLAHEGEVFLDVQSENLPGLPKTPEGFVDFSTLQLSMEVFVPQELIGYTKTPNGMRLLLKSGDEWRSLYATKVNFSPTRNGWLQVSFDPAADPAFWKDTAFDITQIKAIGLNVDVGFGSEATYQGDGIRVRNVRLEPNRGITPQPRPSTEKPQVPMSEFINNSGRNLEFDEFNYGWSVGEFPAIWGQGEHGGFSSPAGRQMLHDALQQMRADGIRTIRIMSLFADLRSGIRQDAQGNFLLDAQGQLQWDSKAMEDLVAFFEELESAGIKVVSALLDCRLVDGIATEST
ncbi:MAG: hypothetical protein HYY57_07380, partial [Candidatus Omnitrophica bacterium]|nr:hypothetical protein [Candidatus Omnitrophota bacterium]